MLPVDKLLLRHGLLRKRVPGDGWCFFHTLLEKHIQRAKDDHVEQKYFTKEEVALAVATELRTYWHFYALYMDTTYMKLTTQAAIDTACDGIGRAKWNQPLGDFAVLAGGAVMQAVLRCWNMNAFYDLQYRGLQMGTIPSVWDIVQTGNHIDNAVSVEKVLQSEEILPQYLALCTDVNPDNIVAVTAEVAGGFPTGGQTWFLGK